MSEETNGSVKEEKSSHPMRSLDVIFKLTEARLALSNGDTEKAKAIFEQILQMDPNNSEAKEYLESLKTGRMPDKSVVISLGNKPHKPSTAGTTISRRRVVEREGRANTIIQPKPASKDGKPADYTIDEIFITTHTGMLIAHFTSHGSMVVDEDIMVGMLNAIQMFTKEVFDMETLQLRQIDLGEFDIQIITGDNISVCAIVSGPKRADVRIQLKYFQLEVESQFGRRLRDWNGNMKEFKGLQPLILKLVTGGYLKK